MTMPKISIIVPVYKVGPYIHRCVDSILAQTFTDFELILVDDGSPDNCGAICDEYAAKDSRIHVIHQKNAGQSVARNLALDWVFANSDSEWLSFIDSDDWVHPMMLELLYHAVCEQNAGLAACDVLTTNEDSIETGNESENGIKTELFFSEEILAHYNEKYYKILTAYACNKLYKRDIFLDLRFDENILLYEDELIALEVIQAAQKVVHVNKKLYFYYQSSGSLMRSGYNIKFLCGLDTLQHMIDFMQNLGIKNEVLLLENKWMHSYLSQYFTIMKGYPQLKEKIDKYKPDFRKKFLSFMRNPYITRAYRTVLLQFVLCPRLAAPLYQYLMQ